MYNFGIKMLLYGRIHDYTEMIQNVSTILLAIKSVCLLVYMKWQKVYYFGIKKCPHSSIHEIKEITESLFLALKVSVC